VVLGHAVLEAVGAVACCALVGGHARRVDECFAGSVVALLLVGVERGLWGEGRGGGGVESGALAGPVARLWALVGVFGAVVEAVGRFAGLAAEGQEVEHMAVGHLAVRPNGFNVALHLGIRFGGCGRHGGVQYLYGAAY